MFFDESKAMDSYESHVVTFVDILGFRDVVRDRSAKEINDMLNAITENAAGSSWPNNVEVLSFSDSVVRAVAYSDNPYRVAFCEIAELAYAQVELALKGILIRGGMTAGEVCVSESRIFGPAFVRAYELETRFAVAPRIVIDTTLIREIRRKRIITDPTYKEEIRKLRPWIIQGDDGLWFVNYLRAQFTPEAPLGHALLMRAHRDMIVERARHLDAASVLVPKYLWLARYHNRVADEMHPGQDDIKVGRSDIPIFDQLLLPKRGRRRTSAEPLPAF